MRSYITPADRDEMRHDTEYLKLTLMWQADYWTATYYDQLSQTTDERQHAAHLDQHQHEIIERFVDGGWQPVHTQGGDGWTVVYLQRPKAEVQHAILRS